MAPVHFDGTISLGSMLSAAGSVLTALVVVAMFKQKVDMLLDLHREQLALFKADLANHRDEDRQQFALLSERLFALTGSVQRLIGQNETRNKADRRIN